MKLKRNLNKKVSAIAAGVFIVAILLVGTFAYYASVSVENIFTGSKTTPPDEPPPAVLHDDFDPNTGQKDVYVENTGDPDSLMYVRVKFNEFLDLSTNTRPLTIAETDWFTHCPSHPDSSCIFNDCMKANNNGDKFHDYFSWTLGGQKWYMPASKMVGEYASYNKGTYVDDTTDYGSLTRLEREELGIKQTPVGGIICIDEYLKMTARGQRAYIGWIYDADGWAYWSQPLKGGEATGLLLSSVTAIQSKLKDYDYCYIIDVIMDVVDADDLPMWTDNANSVDPDITGNAPPASGEAKQVLDIIKSF
ncbi:MAG: hypothetical protein FWF85_00905 [Clostridiales bacterium]|jgi:hypothetical protein|nr:hypothetical protein [Clostridiales bacterium]MDR2712561.1 hypothetical protein [Clostridiales bacterium]